jgi:hypothetical protein
MLKHGETIDNRTLSNLLGVGIMGGIRVNNQRNLIVLVSNNTDPTYRNEWRDEILHFVGMGSVGPQKLGRQNKTLADSTRRKYAVHLFEVSRKGQYTYAGEVELADEPYMSDQPDARAEDRFVWVFPLRKKPASAAPASADERVDHLPYGTYAVVSSDLTDEQRALVDGSLDRLKEAGVRVFDCRDVDRRRYEKALEQWYEAVLDRVRAKVKELIANRKRAARAAGREFNLVDDELRVNSASTEAELRAALAFLDYDDPVAQEQLFDEARGSVPMPDPPESVRDRPESPPDTNLAEIERPGRRASKIDRARFAKFT